MARSKQHLNARFNDGRPECNITTEYLPSNLEQVWLSNAAAWEKDFCSHMAEVESSTRVWLDTLEQLTQLQGKFDDKRPTEVRGDQRTQ